MSRIRKQPPGKSRGVSGKKAGRAAPLEPPVGHAMMFWVLLLLGFATFAPCVLLPAWVRYEEMYQQEQVMTARVDALKKEKVRQERTIGALRTDPAVNERVAVRELRYKRPGERMENVTIEAGHDESLDIIEPIHVNVVIHEPQPPALAAWLNRFLPELPLREVFCASPSREVSLSMSIGMMVLAFWLYSPRIRST